MGSNDHGPGDPDLWAKARKLVAKWRESAEKMPAEQGVCVRACADELERAMRR